MGWHTPLGKITSSWILMTVRWINTLVLCFWFASMSWLAVAKIMPALLGGDPPDYQSVLDSRAGERASWKVGWRARTIGFATTRILRDSSGSAEVRSVVQFDKLPLDAMVSELFGALGAVLRPLLDGSGDLQLEMLVATRTRFDADHRLEGFDTTVDVGDMRGFLRIHGRITPERKLDLVARLGEAVNLRQGDGEVFRRRIELPPNALISDSLAPRPELKNLAVGQSWTIPVYRAFPPNHPVQIVHAEVERHEIILWQGSDVETMLVVYRSDAGSHINVARDPTGREWIRRDGTVLRRELQLSGLRIRFERLPESIEDPRHELLDERLHPRLWDFPSELPSPAEGRVL